MGIGQGYWTATPIQMAKALNTLINDGTVKTPHLLQSTRVNGALVPFKQEESTQIGDIPLRLWEIAKDGMYGVANRPNGTARKYLRTHLIKPRRNRVPHRYSAMKPTTPTNWRSTCAITN